MEARQCPNALEYVAHCRHWKQFTLALEDSIQSQSSSSNGRSEAHLPVPVSSGSSQQLQQNQQQPTPRPPANELVSLPASTNELSVSRNTTGQSTSSSQMATSAGVGVTAGGNATDGTSESESLISTQAAGGRYASRQEALNARVPTVARAAGTSVPQRQEPGGSAVSASGGAESMRWDSSSESLCRVCYDRPINVVLVPCGHFDVCASCAERCKDCPICRRPIRGTVRILKYSN